LTSTYAFREGKSKGIEILYSDRYGLDPVRARSFTTARVFE